MSFDDSKPVLDLVMKNFKLMLIQIRKKGSQDWTVLLGTEIKSKRWSTQMSKDEVIVCQSESRQNSRLGLL